MNSLVSQSQYVCEHDMDFFGKFMDYDNFQLDINEIYGSKKRYGHCLIILILIIGNLKKINFKENCMFDILCKNVS